MRIIVKMNYYNTSIELSAYFLRIEMYAKTTFVN